MSDTQEQQAIEPEEGEYEFVFNRLRDSFDSKSLGYKWLTEIEEALEASQARVAELEAALRFYADENNWTPEPGDSPEEMPFSPAGMDMGDVARRVLGMDVTQPAPQNPPR